jgi:hypothetical protein
MPYPSRCIDQKDSNMKKILFVLAACVLSSAALAQPMPERRGPGYDRPHAAPHHRKQKVWVPAHRERGRRVPGHYVWR